MTQPKDKPARSGWGRTANFLLPVKAIGRATQAVGDTKKSLAQMARQFRDNLPGQGRAIDAAPDDPRAISDPRLRFEKIYELNGWTPEALQEQLTAVRRTKVASLVMSVLTLGAVIAALLLAPLWMLLVAMPIGGCLLVLGSVQVFKYAHFQAQLEFRSLIAAREFASLPDFFFRLLK